jgi:hypothetical protein
MRPPLCLGTSPEERLAALDERGPPALRVKADAVAGEQPLVDPARDPGRQHGPMIGADPGDVDEVGDPRVGAHGAHETGDEVEVVVVDEEGRARQPVELFDRGHGERLVDLHVPVAPRP